MSNSDVDRKRVVTMWTGGHTVKQTGTALYDDKGRLIRPVQWVYEPRPQVTTEITTMEEKRSSVITPGFNSPNRPRFLPANNFSYRKFELTESQYNGWTYSPGSNTRVPVDTTTTEIPTRRYPMSAGGMPAKDFDALNRRAVTALRNKIKSQSINAAQAVAERKRTAQTVADAARTIAKAVSAVKRGDVIGAAKALGVQRPRSARQSRSRQVSDAAAHHWLSLQYGWKPLLNDVYGAAEQLAKAHNNVQFKTVTQSVSQTWSDKITIRHAAVENFSGPNETRYRYQERVDIRYGCTYTQSNPKVVELKEWGITNPAQLAWELVPFSFVADWFLPVGNFLSSLDATLGLEFQSGYMTVFREFQGDVRQETMLKHKSDGRFISNWGGNTWTLVQCSRTRLAGFPSARIPSFKNPVSVTHAVTAVALLSQLFKR